MNFFAEVKIRYIFAAPFRNDGNVHRGFENIARLPACRRQGSEHPAKAGGSLVRDMK